MHLFSILHCYAVHYYSVFSNVSTGFFLSPHPKRLGFPPWRNTGVIKKNIFFFLLKHKTDNSVWYLLPNIHFVPNRGARNIYFFFYTQTVMPMCVLIIKTMETGHASKIFFVLENAGGSRRVTRFPSLKWLLFVRLASISTKTRLWSNTFTLTRQGRLELSSVAYTEWNTSARTPHRLSAGDGRRSERDCDQNQLYFLCKTSTQQMHEIPVQIKIRVRPNFKTLHCVHLYLRD